MIISMRTTILLDDELGERFRRVARARKQSLSRFLAEAGRAALKAERLEAQNDFELVTFKGSGVVDGVDLDRSGELIAAEDEVGYGR